MYHVDLMETVTYDTVFDEEKGKRRADNVDEPRYIQGEEMLRRGWLFRIILVVIWGGEVVIR